MSKALFAGTLLMMLSPLPAWSDTQAPWLPNIISAHMVVQQGVPVPLWGKDVAGTTIKATLAGASAETKAGEDGRWSLKLPAMKAGGPYTLVISGSATKSIDDVLVGEVWLGSGQSNMELALRATKDHDQEAAAATDGKIRLFNADRTARFTPQDDVIGSWQVCSPETAKGFSAVAYHFGRTLRGKQDAPVGLIVACWGGSPGEDWIAKEDLDKEPVLAPLMKEWDADKDRHDLWDQGESFDVNFMPLDPIKGAHCTWAHSEKSDSQGKFEALDEGKAAAGHYFGLVKGGAWGSAIGAFKAAPGGTVDLSGQELIELKVKGSGTVMVSLGQPSITDYDFYISQPFQLTPEWKTVAIPLASLKQGGWGEPKPFTPKTISSLNFSLQVPYWPDLGSSTFNGMIAPLTHTPIKGVLWYQGESNAGRAAQYNTVLGTLFKSWRQAWGQPELPFFIVQLPGYGDGGGNWATLRESQRQAILADAHADLVSTLDLGEHHDIHPKNKRPVGERLAEAAWAKVYGKKDAAVGPRLKSVTRDGAKVTLSFEHAKAGLETIGDASGGLELAGTDGVFHPCSLQLKGEQVVANAEGVSEPKTLRHAWADDPASYLAVKKGQPVLGFQESLK